MRSYSLAYAGGAAKAGESCWGSPGTIGAFIGSGSGTGPANHIYNIVQIQQDLSYHSGTSGYRNVGWIYETGTGDHYWQAAPGMSIGVGAGAALVSGSLSYDPTNAIMHMLPIGGARLFSIGATVTVTILHGTGTFHTKGCFTGDWNGSP